MSSLPPIFILTPLRATTPDRREKAEAGLQDGSLTVTITQQTRQVVRALVKHGERAYGVALTDAAAHSVAVLTAFSIPA